jgi:hypothetical protein
MTKTQEDKLDRACNTNESDEKCILLVLNPEQKDFLGELSVDGRIILKLMLGKCVMRTCMELAHDCVQ